MEINQKVFKGENSFGNAVTQLRETSDIKNIIVFCSKSVAKYSGISKIIRENFELSDIKYYSNIPNVTNLSDIKEFLNSHRSSNKIDLIIAVGGGSIIDFSKSVKAYLSVNHEKTLFENDFFKKKLINIPTIAVPTTAGSGSDATEFSVLYNRGLKYSINHKGLRPTFVALEGKMLRTLPPRNRIISGLDLIAQCIEGSWSKQSGSHERILAKKTLSRVAAVMERYISGSNEASILQEMIECAHDAGLIINKGKTTAAHAWSYGFTLRYEIPHGQAVWLTLPRIIQLNLQKAHAQKNYTLSQHIEDLCDILSISTDENLVHNIFSKVKNLGLDVDISKYKFQKADLLNIMKEPNLERMKNNPFVFSNFEEKYIFQL